jgi:hypothetical protein
MLSTPVTCLTLFREVLHEMQCFVSITLDGAGSFDIQAAFNKGNE